VQCDAIIAVCEEPEAAMSGSLSLPAEIAA